MTATNTSSITCPKHNDPLKVYCETCRQVICCECTISTEHKRHRYYLISECYAKHHQEIEASLQTVKNKIADLNKAVTQLDATKMEVTKQAEQLQQQINTHTQKIIDQVQNLREHVSQELHNIVKQKTQLLAKQTQQAQNLSTQLTTCQEKIENRLKEWTQHQILTEKYIMINEMNTTTQHVDPTVFKPIEKADMIFQKKDIINSTSKKGIGLVSSITCGKATLTILPFLPRQKATATLVLRSQDNSRCFPLPVSLISCTLSSGNAQNVKCAITDSYDKYKIAFTPYTKEDKLRVLIGGVDISDRPFTLPNKELHQGVHHAGSEENCAVMEHCHHHDHASC